MTVLLWLTFLFSISLQSLLTHVSRPTKNILNKLGVFTVSSFHAFICARSPSLLNNLLAGRGATKRRPPLLSRSNSGSSRRSMQVRSYYIAHNWLLLSPFSPFSLVYPKRKNTTDTDFIHLFSPIHSHYLTGQPLPATGNRIYYDDTSPIYRLQVDDGRYEEKWQLPWLARGGWLSLLEWVHIYQRRLFSFCRWNLNSRSCLFAGKCFRTYTTPTEPPWTSWSCKRFLSQFHAGFTTTFSIL